MRDLLADFRQGLRAMWRNPVVTLAVALSLGLGIGANSTVFSLVHAVFLKPLPLHEPEGLQAMYTVDARFRGFSPVSWRNYEDFRDQNTVMSGLAAFMATRLNLSSGGEPRQVVGEIVSGNYFEVLGVRMLLGRAISPTDDHTLGAHPVVVLSHALFSRFGADESLLGQTIQLNGRPFTIIGVTAPGYRGTSLLEGTELWVPLAMYQQVLNGPFLRFFEERRALFLNTVGRLRDGTTPAEATAAMQTIASRLEQAYPIDNEDRGVTLLPLTQANIQPDLRSNAARASVVLSVTVGVVLLIACANIANLLLARASSRRKEIAMRLALGSSRGRLIRQLLVESLLLGLVGGLAALALSALGVRLLWALRPPMLEQAAIDLSPDPVVFLFTLAVAVASAMIFGLVPALAALRLNLVSALRGTAEVPSRLLGAFGLRQLIVVLQVTLAFVALVGAGLFLRSLGQAQRIDPGFDVEPVLAVSFDIGAQGYDQARGESFYDRLLERVARAPGAERSSLASNIPLSNVGGFQRSIRIEGQEPPPGVDGIYVVTNVVTPEHFETLGIQMRSGRAFTDFDRAETEQVVIINETMEDHYWPDQGAVGQGLSFFGDETPRQVVGVVADSKNFTIGETPQSTVYLPLRQNYASAMTLFVRTGGDPSVLVDPMSKAVQELDPGLPLIHAWTISEVLQRSLWAPRLVASLLQIFGGLSLILAVIGIYGVMAYVVNLRRREIGIRMAIGAGRPNVFSMILGQGFLIVTVGILVGAVAAFFLSLSVSSLLYGIGPVDVVTFLGVAALLAVAALGALAVPAQRAIRLDPVRVLRLE